MSQIQVAAAVEGGGNQRCISKHLVLVFQSTKSFSASAGCCKDAAKHVGGSQRVGPAEEVPAGGSEEVSTGWCRDIMGGGAGVCVWKTVQGRGGRGNRGGTGSASTVGLGSFASPLIKLQRLGLYSW